tara:strand:- start:511 stop:828 length:318 start_codon:yes stop_codon:yes gene_type:complete
MSENGWEIHSKLVLKELETLAASIRQLQAQIVDLKSEIAEIKAREDKVQMLTQWKDRIDEVTSPTQLRDLKNQVARLQDFKVKATTAFIAVQMVVAGAFALLKLF